MKSLDFPRASEYACYWPLDPDTVYLNHGSFGACPWYVLEKQSEYRRMLEVQPVRFLIREMEERFDGSRRKVAAFLNASADDVVFVSNATAAVNTVFRSLVFHPGDEILITNHIYGACRRLMEFICDRSGAKLVEAYYNFPILSPDLIIEAVIDKVTPRTRIALIDHISSPTAIIHPVERIVEELTRRGIDTMIDGAHSLGSIPLDLEKIGAAYYTANCHKWLCSPISAAILHVRADKQKQIVPLVVSHAGHEAEPFPERFFWPGTTDPSAAICAGDALDYLSGMIPGGWPAIMEHNHLMCLRGRDIICQSLAMDPPAPSEILASMATFPIPLPPEIKIPDYKGTEPLQDYLFREYNIELPVFYWGSPPRRFARISAQLYNSLEQYAFFSEKLSAALIKEVRG